MLRILTLFLLLCVPVLQSCQHSSGDKPLIISTIKPVQALVYAVAGKHAQELELYQLLPDGASPHHYALKPSDAHKLENARAIFYIDPNLEVFLDKALGNLPPQTLAVELSQIPGIRHLHSRTQDEVRHHDNDEHDAHEHGTEDLHLWLNPDNAIAMTKAIGKTLGSIDPVHSADYIQNANEVTQRITAMDEHIKQQLQNVQKRPYISFHDAWQHFDTHFGLNFTGAVTLDVSRLPGARHVQTIRQIIEQKQAVCLFREPQFPPALIHTLVEGANIRIGTLDPLGSQLPLNENTYTTLLQNAADSFASCLGNNNASQ